MKIIDLLNKIANGEEVPKKIRFDNTYWNRICGEKNMYYENDYDDSLFVYFFRRDLTFTLNDEIEIIEEKKIPKKLNLKLDDWTTPTQCDIELSKKIDKIIDYLDYLKSKGDE